MTPSPASCAPLLEMRGVGKVFRAAPCAGEGLRGALFARRAPESESIAALAGVDFTLMPGEIVGVIGANGAGKSTLLKIAARILRPSEGVCRVHGKVTPLLSLEAGFADDLSGRENLRLFGRAVGWPEADLPAIVEEALDFAGLPARFADLPVKLYSTGMRSRLVFSAATRFDPDVLLVDEVLTVGDLAFQEKSFARLLDLVARARGALVASHALTQLRRVCRRLLLLDRGRVVRDGPFDEVVAYLEETARRDREARAEYDILRRPEDLAADALAGLLERVAANVPESALPPMRFDRAFPLDLDLPFGSSLLPFTRHRLRLEEGHARAETELLSPPPALRARLAERLDLAALRARGAPVVFSLAPAGAPPFDPVRSFVPFPLPGDRLVQGPGVARATAPALRVSLDWSLPADRPWSRRFLVYRILPAPCDLTRHRTAEFHLISTAPCDLVFRLFDAERADAYSQLKRLPGGPHETRAVFYLDGGFAPAGALDAIRARVRGWELEIHPHGAAGGRLELTLPAFLGFDPSGAALRDLETDPSLGADDLTAVALELAPPAGPPLDADGVFRVARGHVERGMHEAALPGLLALLGRIENAELHAFASRALEGARRSCRALPFALHAIHLALAGRGELPADRVEFARAALRAANAPLSLLALERAVGEAPRV